MPENTHAILGPEKVHKIPVNLQIRWKHTRQKDNFPNITTHADIIRYKTLQIGTQTKRRMPQLLEFNHGIAVLHKLGSA